MTKEKLPEIFILLVKKMFVFAPPPEPVIPLCGERYLFFPVHRVYCVGFNYSAHSAELGWSERQPPIFFMKPADAVFPVAEKELGEVPYPPATSDYEHEIELAVALGRGGSGIPLEKAAGCVYGWAAGIDFTRRDLQVQDRNTGSPWDNAKGGDFSLPVTPIRPAGQAGDMGNTDLWLYVNGTRRQHGCTRDMVWKVPEIISELSKVWTLQPGDIILTGTPPGVGPVVRGDVVEAGIGGVGTLRFRMV